MAEAQQLVDMGFAHAEAELALRESGGNMEQALELLLTGTQPEPEVESKPDKANRFGPLADNATTTDTEWPELPKPITSSGYSKGSDRPPGLETVKDDLGAALDLSLEDMVPTPQMPRTPGLPCGLLNVGNTCYVNSLLQTLFHAEEFRDQLLHFRAPTSKAEENAGGAPTAERMAAERRREHALQLVLELRKLFAYCHLSERSCVSPEQLLHELVDLQGRQVPVGGQEDVSEFMLKFVDQLEEGFAADSSEEKDEAGERSQSRKALHELLYGEQVQLFSYVDQAPSGSAASPTSQGSEPKEPEEAEKGPVTSSEQSDFLQIFLDVKHRNLYAAWAAANEQNVDYTTPAGAKAQGQTRVWIKRLPKLLFFQLQRVTFDPETKEQVKIDDEFDFESTIYPDRFLQRNEATVLHVEQTAEKLRSQKAEKERALQRFRNYQDLALPVTDLLRSAASCLEANALALKSSERPAQPAFDPDSAAMHASEGQVSDESSAPKPDWIQDLQASERPAQALRALADACQSQVEQLQEEVAVLDRKLSEAYLPLQKEGYELFGIWAHQGQQAEARSGHYVAFLKDWREDRWMRFSDSFVSIVSWEEVRKAALGGQASAQNDTAQNAKSRSSAYVLVYMDAALADSQRERVGTCEIPDELVKEILSDNRALQSERGSWQEQVRARELKQHAQAIFQEYGGLLHLWNPKKSLGDASGNPHSQDANHRRQLNDPALMSIELFLYKSGGEPDVFHYLVKKSLDAQRGIRCWQQEDEGRILFYFAEILRSQDCSVKMFREKLPAASEPEGDVTASELPKPAAVCKECELVELDLEALHARYETVLVQANILDEALQLLKRESGLALPQAIGLLTMLWASFNLDMDYQFRHNEVLLVLSALMYNTVSCIEEQDLQRQESYRELGEYFYIVLTSVEWPRNWKLPLQQRIIKMFSNAREVMEAALDLVLMDRAEREGAPGIKPVATLADYKLLVQKQTLPFLGGRTLEEFREHPPAGEAFFDRHRALWSWAMQNDRQLAKEYVDLAILS